MFGAWLVERMADAGLSQADIMRGTGRSSVTVSRWVNGEDIPAPASCRRIARVLGLPVETVYQAAGHDGDAGQESLPARRSPRSRADVLAELQVVDAIEVPFYDITASASPGRAFLNETPADYGYLPDRARYRKGRMVGILVRGDCLAPLVRDGDRLFIDTQAEWTEGDIVLAVVDGALHLKRLRSAGNGWELAPDNGAGAIPVTDGVHILGKFHGVWRLGL